MKKISVLTGFLFIVITLFALPIFTEADAATRYVAPSSMGGNNANPGTEESPWRTIVYAVSNSNSGDIIKLMDDADNSTKDYSETDWVFVNKQLTIERYDDDATKPWVYTQVHSKHVFYIAADYVTIIGLKITGATSVSQAGIYVGSKNYCTFNDNDITNNYYGIYLNSSNNCNMTDNNVSYNNSTSGIGDSEGILLSSSSDNTLNGNTINYNRKTGIDVNGTSAYPSTNNTLNNNTVNHNGSFGITLGTYTSNNTLGNNTANSNTYDGIYITVSSSNNHNIINNTTSYNGRYGIGISSGNNNTVSGNTSESNTKHGIYLNSTSGNDIIDNICRSNHEYGIYLGWGSNTIRGNLIENNTSYGIYITSSGTPDLGGVDSGNEGRNTIRNNDAGIYQLYNNTANTIYAYRNYWVYTEFDDIDNHIYDNDESGSTMGSVLFSPWLENDQSLPVELTSFTALYSVGCVILKWITESEVDIDHFNLYRSIDKEINYNKIATIQGQGNTPTRHNYLWIDTRVQSGTTYWYKLSDVDIYGLEVFHEPVFIALEKALPQEFFLSQNYPNPFNPITDINYHISVAGDVELSIYNTLGQKVRTLVKKKQSAGFYNVKFDSQDLPSGIYIYKIQAGEFMDFKKMVLLK